jgi:hypothetical protein
MPSAPRPPTRLYHQPRVNPRYRPCRTVSPCISRLTCPFRALEDERAWLLIRALRFKSQSSFWVTSATMFGTVAPHLREVSARFHLAPAPLPVAREVQEKPITRRIGTYSKPLQLRTDEKLGCRMSYEPQWPTKVARAPLPCKLIPHERKSSMTLSPSTDAVDAPQIGRCDPAAVRLCGQYRVGGGTKASRPSPNFGTGRGLTCRKLT